MEKGKDGYGMLVRYGNERGITVFPPSLTGQGWVENHTGEIEPKELHHSAADIANAIGINELAKAMGVSDALGRQAQEAAD